MDYRLIYTYYNTRSVQNIPPKLITSKEPIYTKIMYLISAIVPRYINVITQASLNLSPFH